MANSPVLSHRRLDNGKVEVIYTLAEDSTDVFVGLWSQHAFYIRTLVEEPFGQAGEHRIVWNGKDQNGDPAGPGVYISRMSTGNNCGASDRFVAAG